MNLTVSAHFLIRRNGKVIQFVPLHQRAWHAGQSYCEGRTRVNDFSVGIELEGTDDLPFEDAQYESLARLTGIIRRMYPAITRERIYGHGDIAPGRKTDPGPMRPAPAVTASTAVTLILACASFVITPAIAPR